MFVSSVITVLSDGVTLLLSVRVIPVLSRTSSTVPFARDIVCFSPQLSIVILFALITSKDILKFLFVLTTTSPLPTSNSVELST